MTVLPNHGMSMRSALMSMVLCAVVLVSTAPRAGAGEDCYRPEELRADAEAKLALFYREALIVCGNVIEDFGIESWEAFRAEPEIAAGLARADEVRAPRYQRLYGGENWKLRWERTEFTVTGYAGDVMEERAPGRAGCTKLRQEVTGLTAGGWPAYSAAVDRFFATMQPQVRLCGGE